MKIILISLYIACAIGFLVWQEAMDRAYGVKPGASTSSIPLLAISAVWPLAIPVAMWAVLDGGAGRWDIQPKPPGTRS